MPSLIETWLCWKCLCWIVLNISHAYVLCHVCPHPRKALEDTDTVSTFSKEDKGDQLLEEAVWEARIKQYHQAATCCCLAMKSERRWGVVFLRFLLWYLSIKWTTAKSLDTFFWGGGGGAGALLRIIFCYFLRVYSRLFGQVKWSWWRYMSSDLHGCIIGAFLLTKNLHTWGYPPWN